MAEAKRDGNYVPTLLGVSSSDGVTPVTIYADPTTHRLYVDSTGSGSPLTTKGDIYTFSTIDAALAVGTNGQVLSADDSTATGLKWITAAGSGTVTDVSVVTANGISGTVATSTTTPAITLALGVITPTSVNGLTLAAQTVGFTIAGGTTSKTLTVPLDASVSGTNTGDNAANTSCLALDQTTSQTIINGQPIQDTLTASEIVATDASKKLSSLAVATYPSLVELAYVKGVTSAIQTQLNGKLTTTLTSTNIFVGNGSNIATGVALTGDAALSNAGVLGVNKVRLNVRNETGSTLASTKAVYVSGFNNFPLVTLADNTVDLKHNVVGITIAPINTSSDGFIATAGQCDAETNAFTVGDELYLSTSGALVNTAPTSGGVQHIGIVTVKANYPTGKILIYQQVEQGIIASVSGEDVIVRMGDAIGAKKSSFRDYANNEVASINSDGVINSTPLTASEILITDASKNIISAPVATYPSLTELSYVKGVTSAVQTQLGAKASLTGTETLTNKRITKRVVTTTDDATAVIDVDVTDTYELSAVANATTFSTTGTPTDSQKLMIRFKDAGTAKALTWDAIFVAIGVTAPTTTVAGKWHYVGCEYNTAATKWHIIATGVQA